jgi:hypothetical protein
LPTREIENQIKKLHAMEIDRTGCSRFLANQLRVLLTAAAYMLMQELHLAGHVNRLRPCVGVDDSGTVPEQKFAVQLGLTAVGGLLAKLGLTPQLLKPESWDGSFAARLKSRPDAYL